MIKRRLIVLFSIVILIVLLSISWYLLDRAVEENNGFANCSILIYWEGNKSKDIIYSKFNYTIGLPPLSVNFSNSGNTTINISTYNNQLEYAVVFILPNGTKKNVSSYVPMGAVPTNDTYGTRILQPNESITTKPAINFWLFYNPEIINVTGTYKLYVILNNQFISNEVTLNITEID